MSKLSRRRFLSESSVVVGGLGAASMAGAGVRPAMAMQSRGHATQPKTQPGDTHKGACVIASANGPKCVERAMELLKDGTDPADCIVQGVKIVEDDPNDMSVGYGGLPNEEGVVELDASVMYGPTHKSGAVASVRNIKNVASVALMVLRRTNHCLLVGDGARRFAVEMGFPEENLLTEAARQQWLKWKANASRDDFWLNDDEIDEPVGKPFDAKKQAAAREMRQMYTTGTIHCSAVTAKGDVASCTTTSGLSWKIPGRVGDSPIIGAGNYCDNAVGAGGCTGRGESCITNLSAYTIVMMMEKGMSPTEACVEAAKRMVDRTKEKRLKDSNGRPKFNVSFYALRKDGAYGSSVLIGPGTFVVHDGAKAQTLPSVALFEK
jgi:N4-(beta-N-acetylglucosaminyl)-L-asparaginase